jgi:23S rRNA (guanosine2251-2'-O)-methyltransferase
MSDSDDKPDSGDKPWASKGSYRPGFRKDGFRPGGHGNSPSSGTSTGQGTGKPTGKPGSKGAYWRAQKETRPASTQVQPEIYKPDDGLVVLYGAHPVVEALRNTRRRFVKFMATENAIRRTAEELGIAVDALPIQPEEVRASAIDRLLTPDAVHQGLYLVCEPFPSPRLDNLPDNAMVLALDQVTDPHNVGAVMRSAAAFGVDAILVTTRHSPAFTGVLAKAASGALEHVPVIEVGNLGDALEKLGKRGFLRIGFDSDGTGDFATTPLHRPLVLIMGAEGKGLRQRTRDICDALVRIELPGAIRSLNVSNAAAIALYAAHQRMKPAG